jgi:hypothetical protein
VPKVYHFSGSRAVTDVLPVHSADDSGATAIEFILDTNYHPTEPLLHPEGGLAEFQGPALLAYNNRTFSETDFRSLSKIGDSEKLHDLNSTGKFGRGFNSVSDSHCTADNSRKNIFTDPFTGVQLDG